MELFVPQADNDLRKFLATREQALNNREPAAGSDQDISREDHESMTTVRDRMQNTTITEQFIFVQNFPKKNGPLPIGD